LRGAALLILVNALRFYAAAEVAQISLPLTLWKAGGIYLRRERKEGSMNRIAWGYRALLMFALLFAGAAAPFARAQSTTGAISGIVSDSSGAVIQGAALAARNVATGAVRSTTSNSEGAFRIPLLPVETYEATAEAAGFAAGRVANVVVTIGGDANVRFVLEPAGVEAAVRVSSEAPLIETSKSAVDTVVSERMIANLPTNGRNFIDFVLTTPGVVKDNFRVGDISFAGQRGTLKCPEHGRAASGRRRSADRPDSGRR